MTDLFQTDAKPDPEAEGQRFDWINKYCREKFAVPDGWRWFSWSRKEFDKPHEYLLVSGAVCTAKIERGKRKGQTNWRLRDKATEATHVIRRSELEAFQHEWQALTGLCFECYGTGQEWDGWSAAAGNRYAPCHHCKATGTFSAAA
jgi:hypothetical protein